MNRLFTLRLTRPDIDRVEIELTNGWGVPVGRGQVPAAWILKLGAVGGEVAATIAPESAHE